MVLEYVNGFDILEGCRKGLIVVPARLTRSGPMGEDGHEVIERAPDLLPVTDAVAAEYKAERSGLADAGTETDPYRLAVPEAEG